MFRKFHLTKRLWLSPLPSLSLVFLRPKSVLKVTKNLALITNETQEGSSSSGWHITDGRFMLTEGSKSKQSQHQNPIDSPPLCLMGTWPRCKKSVMRKYIQLYLDQGFHILLMKTQIKHIIHPDAAVRNCDDVLTFLNTNAEYKKIMWHGFSSSGYIWAIMMLMMEEKDECFSSRLLPRFVGQVWDSPVDPEGVAKGLAVALSPNKTTLQLALQNMLEDYIQLKKDTLGDAFKAAYAKFQNNQLTCPALFLFSQNDPIANHENILKTIKLWQRRQINVRMKIFKDSPHCAHFKNYPDEYKKELLNYLEYIKLSGKSS